jgi:HK97 family phage major capsid protein
METKMTHLNTTELLNTNTLTPNTFNQTLLTKQMNFLEKSGGENPHLPKGLGHYLKTGEMEDWEQKALTSGAESGGILLPEHEQALLEEGLIPLCPMRQVCGQTTISGGTLDLLLAPQGGDVGWVKESDSRGETKEPLLSKISITTHEIYAKPRATQRLLDDAKMDVESWLRRAISKSMSRAENAAFTLGDGLQQPRGFLSVNQRFQGSAVSSGIETFKSGAPGSLGSTPVDLLIRLYYALPQWYMSDACWMMPRAMLPLIKTLKMGDHYIWSPATSQGMHDLLLGQRVVLNDDMPAPHGQNATTSLAFGNFKSGYMIVDRAGIETLRDPYSSKPYVEFYTTKRVGGDVVDMDAIKLLHLGE